MLPPAPAACAQDGLDYLALYDVDILAIRKLVIYILLDIYDYNSVHIYSGTCVHFIRIYNVCDCGQWLRGYVVIIIVH